MQHHYSGVTSVFMSRRPNRSKIKPFDPNHPRYLHCWCCYAHVRTVIRVLAFIFTLISICKAPLIFSYGANIELNVLFTACDFLATAVLVLICFGKCGTIFGCCTYVWVQICNMCCIMFQIGRVDPREKEIVIFGKNRATEGALLILVWHVFWLCVIGYSIMILINYEHFKSRRNAAEERYRERVRYAERNPQEDSLC